eukprot:CAMPEP_0115020554 /NCGR_PEP_ID=MMETSP0216-20121206/30242_1 /TAXON_ID=223996 /ORGANISM="Protocruzia adherens, Strain Boccale" /LENGTH=492 /DNA_ID=CAMNT_0002392505 /DNA_START=20 /DNA_END=1498 /DNA_ORIENTATION=+
MEEFKNPDHHKWGGVLCKPSVKGCGCFDLKTGNYIISVLDVIRGLVLLIYGFLYNFGLFMIFLIILAVFSFVFAGVLWYGTKYQAVGVIKKYSVFKSIQIGLIVFGFTILILVFLLSWARDSSEVMVNLLPFLCGNLVIGLVEKYHLWSCHTRLEYGELGAYDRRYRASFKIIPRISVFIDRATAGDLILIRSTVPIDRNFTASPILAKEIQTTATSLSMVNDSKTFSGWDSAAIVVEGNLAGGKAKHLLEITPEGVRLFELFERMKHHLQRGHKLALKHFRFERTEEINERISHILGLVVDRNLQELYEEKEELVKSWFNPITNVLHENKMNTKSKAWQEMERAFYNYADSRTKEITSKRIHDFLEEYTGGKWTWTKQETVTFFDEDGNGSISLEEFGEKWFAKFRYEEIKKDVHMHSALTGEFLRVFYDSLGMIEKDACFRPTNGHTFTPDDFATDHLREAKSLNFTPYAIAEMEQVLQPGIAERRMIGA